jgi:carbamoyl-phosphate synthase large subunit
MPKRTDIKRILIIGSGPIVIGQACEFDYSGTQACRALRDEGYQVVLVNSNPATIMTDPETADATYIEPLTTDVLDMIIERERPDALLPTMGGQTALNLTVDAARAGIFQKYNVKLIGANLEAIHKAENRDLFKQAMERIGLEVPESAAVSNMDEGMRAVELTGFPAILRPAFTLGGTGAGIAYNVEEYRELLKIALDLSPVSQVLIEQSLLGWKEYELEVMRDSNDNVVIICSIENFDPMGVHTGDSITVAPAQTLSDKEYQRMRDTSIAIIREIGVDTGGSNIQFALNPADGRMMIIEMNPRVSRSSALASKATGFPIAKIAAKLAVGLTLDEILNDITRVTPASFEPAIDYVVTKIPRFTFEKFPEAEPTLTIQMKSVGEVMAIGRTFKESLQKAVRSLEADTHGFETVDINEDILKARLKTPNPDRLHAIAEAFRRGMDAGEINGLTAIDPWFLNNIKEIVEFEAVLEGFRRFEGDPGAAVSGDSRHGAIGRLPAEILRRAKEHGFSDGRIAGLIGSDEAAVRRTRKELGITAVYKMVDTCAAEFEARTPYLYSTYERPFHRVEDFDPASGRFNSPGTIECEAAPTNRKKIIILGSGPNRIGQGIEFDYCCVHAVYAVKELGYEAIMINCNPETVSTDYDTSDRLYFEPLTIEDVLGIIDREKPEGVIVQFGGQTPLKLAVPLEREGVKILGTPPDAIDRAEDRSRFKELLEKLGIRQPESGTAMSVDEAVAAASRIGYPVLVRPSYVLGGRAMEIVYKEEALRGYMERAARVSPEHPVLIDKYLSDAVEVDVDAVSDGTDVIIGGVMEHIEEAGIHSGDSACSLPPYSLSAPVIEEIRAQTRAMALELGVVGLMNVQFAVKNNAINEAEVYVLEVNPRASRTVPFVSKTMGVPLAKVAAKLMTGMTLRRLGLVSDCSVTHTAVKESVFPFNRFYGVDTILGPEMKSTGEVMGIDDDFGMAYAKAQSSSCNRLPLSGKIFLSVRDEDKAATVEVARTLIRNGFSLVATRGTAAYLGLRGIDVDVTNKVVEGRPHALDLIKNGEINYIINTVSGDAARRDSRSIRIAALQYKIPYSTTMAGARAVARAVEMLKTKPMGIRSLQEYHGRG